MHPEKLLSLGAIDHYTLIVSNARESSAFHQRILGFELIEVREVNQDDAEYGMINYIMRLPTETKYCVITQGLSELSLFHKLMLKYGEGIHHVAYSCDNIENSFAILQQNSICTTSDKISIDPITHLKQFFIDRKYFGYFVEIIERREGGYSSIFTNNNMSNLAESMRSFTEKP